MTLAVIAQDPHEQKEYLVLIQGRQHAFAQIFNTYRSRIFSTALRFLKSRELAEETVQEVFLKVWSKRAELSHVLDFEAYLFTMTRNQIYDNFKVQAEEAAAKNEFARSTGYASGTDYPLIEKQYSELLEHVVEKLPPQQKQIFRLAKIEGLSHKDIADQLNISRLTVKTHMAKALQTIRRSLQHHLTSIVLIPFLWIFQQ